MQVSYFREKLTSYHSSAASRSRATCMLWVTMDVGIIWKRHRCGSALMRGITAAV